MGGGGGWEEYCSASSTLIKQQKQICHVTGLSKCITRLESLKLKNTQLISSIFDSSFFEFEPKTQLDLKRETES